MLPWYVHHFRVSVFSANGRAVPERLVENLFSEMTNGLAPEVDEWRGNKTIHRRQGALEGARVELLEQPYRVDFTLIGPLNLEIGNLEGTLEDAALCSLPDIRNYRQQANELVKNTEQQIRFAIGGLLYLPAESADASYRHLAQLVPKLDLDRSRTSEFVLQINQYKKSDVFQDRQLNRLCTYMSVASGFLNISAPRPNPNTFWTQITPDISTAADNNTPFDSDQVEPIFDEMFEAFEFVTEGVK